MKSKLSTQHDNDAQRWIRDGVPSEMNVMEIFTEMYRREHCRVVEFEPKTSHLTASVDVEKYCKVA